MSATNVIKNAGKPATQARLPVKKMVIEALTELNGNSKKGASFQSIKKFMQARYNYDENSFKYVKKFLIIAVKDGIVKKTTGSENSSNGKEEKTKKT